MAALHDVARFDQADPDVIVTACLACPVCLRRPSAVFLPEDDSAAGCVCHGCDIRWTVSLGFGQSLRMKLAPPAGLFVVKIPSGTVLERSRRPLDARHESASKP
jgi:hypothetical protein